MKVSSNKSAASARQMIIGSLAILLVLEATRRAVGLPIVIIASLFGVYALFGQYMPGMLAHRGLSLEQFVHAMFFTTEGILGTPLQVSSTYIFLFLLFGAFLVQTGVGNYFNDLAVSLTGRRIGGPAKVAIFSSALNGPFPQFCCQYGHNRILHHSNDEEIGIPPELCWCRRSSCLYRWSNYAADHGAAAFLMIEFAGSVIGKLPKRPPFPLFCTFPHLDYDPF